jgi:hypothetical protein
MKADIGASSNITDNMESNSIEDSLKYAGKTETQINYLKQIEEMNKQTN